MGDEIVIFFVGISLAMLLLMSTVVLFLYQYRKRKIVHGVELERVAEAHKIELLNAKVLSQRNTMEEIGKELHDNIGQKVTLASIYLQQIQMKQAEEVAKKEINNVNKMMNELLYELRMLSKSLVQHEQLESDLSVLIKSELERMRFATTIKFDFNWSCSADKLNSQQRNAYLRIFQEFVQNSMKHSKCSEITIELLCDDNALTMMCKDNGEGFVAETEVPGIGLTNMKRRATDIGATLSIETSQGNGVILCLTLNRKK